MTFQESDQGTSRAELVNSNVAGDEVPDLSLLLLAYLDETNPHPLLIICMDDNAFRANRRWCTNRS